LGSACRRIFEIVKSLVSAVRCDLIYM
jgi:hypothetical protein